MEQYLLALKTRLDNDEITQEIYDELVEKLTMPEEEPIKTTPLPSLEERLQMAEDTIMFMLLGGM